MKKVLVVEDNETNMYLITFMLKKNGFEVIEARTGEDGIDLQQKRNRTLYSWIFNFQASTAWRLQGV